MAEDSCENYKRATEYYMGINGGVSDPDALMSVPIGQWRGSMSDQIIFRTGYDIRCDPSDEGMRRSMDRLLRLIQTRPLSPDHMRHIVNALRGYWDKTSPGLDDTIEGVFGSMILYLIGQYVSDQSLMSAMRRSNPEMLERISGEAPGDQHHGMSEAFGRVDMPSADGSTEFEIGYSGYIIPCRRKELGFRSIHLILAVPSASSGRSATG